MTSFPRPVFSSPARLSARLVLQTLLRRLARFAAHLTPDRSKWGLELRKLATGALYIAIILVTLGFAGNDNAWPQQPRASVTGTPSLASIIPTPGSAVAADKFKEYQTANCGTSSARCASESSFMTSLGAGEGLNQGGFLRLPSDANPQAGGSFAPTLSSSEPDLPFLGNRLVAVSFVNNSAVLANVTASYAVVLRRQSDCSLDEDFILPGAATPDASYFTTLTGAQDFFHQLSGLTTTADVFANSCTDQVLGLPATSNVLLLGLTSDGAAITAELANTGLYVSVTDLTANTFTTTQLTNSQTAGVFSAASLRNNGSLDLVETGLIDPKTSQQSTAVFLSNGNGTFQPAVFYDVPGDFTIDDVNGDGIPDIVVLAYSSVVNAGYPIFTGTVTTLIGKGDGTFTIGPVSNVTWTDSTQAITGVFKTGDVKDLLIGGTVLFGAGNGSFTQGPTNVAIASSGNSGGVGINAAASLRNNGKLDVVVTEPGFVSIYYGNGDGTFSTGPNYAALPDFMQVTITDIDGDGNPDIVLGTSTGEVYTDGGYDIQPALFQILMGRGDGTFVDSPVYNQGTYAVQGNANNTQLEIASGEFVSGNSDLDLLVFNRNTNGGSPSSLLMMPGNGTGALGTAVTSPVNIGPTFMVAANMNHDTLPDAVLAGNSSSTLNPQVSVLINQGNGTFAGEKDYTLPGSPVSLAVGDFNGDGLADVAVGISGMGVYVLLGQANGTLGTPVQIDSSMNPTGLAAGSLTTDGRTDLVIADQGYFSYVGSGQQVNGALHVYLGNANGTFTSVTAPTTTATNYSVAALGDLNNDGKLDLIVAGNVAGTSAGTGTPNVYTFLGNGDGTFQAANTLALAGQDGIGATSIALADFNKDKNLDVVVGNPNDYTEVLIGNGDGTLINTLLALGQRPATVAAADLLGNGYPEILVGTGDTEGQGDNLTVLLNQPTGWATSLATPTVTVSPSPASITTAQSTMVTVTVSGGTGAATPTGSVILASGTYTSAATTLSSGSAVITVPGSSLAVATDTLTATYTPDSNSSSTYNSAMGANSVTVSAAVTPSFALTNSGPITFEASAATGNTATITVAPANGFTGVVALTCAVTTTPANATSPATCGVTPSVNISGASPQNPTLTVTTTTTTTAGAYGITVTGTSGAITMPTTVTANVSAYIAPSFALSNGGAISISSPGATTGNTTTITVTPSGGFTGNVTLTAALTSSPTGATDPPTFSFGATSPVSITNASNGTGTLTVSTTAATSGSLVRPDSRGAPWFAGSGAVLACFILFFGIPARRRRWRSMLGMLMLLGFIAAGLVSCGGKSKGSSGSPGTTTGNYTITVTGASGSIQQTTTVSVTVN